MPRAAAVAATEEKARRPEPSRRVDAVLEPAEPVGGGEGEDHGGGDDGSFDDVEHKAEAVAAHAGLDELRFEADLLDFQAHDLLFDRLRLVVVSVVNGSDSWVG